MITRVAVSSRYCENLAEAIVIIFNEACLLRILRQLAYGHEVRGAGNPEPASHAATHHPKQFQAI
jgi:hypothetical protein